METKPSSTDNLVVLQIYDSVMQAEIAKSVLDSARIFCVLHGDIMSSIYPIGTFSTRLLVKPEEFEMAKTLLCIEH